jgi:hypothetical protein
MKNIAEIRDELSKAKELNVGLIYSDIKPPQQIIDMYQEIFDMFHYILSTKRDTIIEKLEKLSNEDTMVEIKAQSNLYINKEENLKSEIMEINSYIKNLSKYIILGGGCLSEQFIDGYENDFKDVDFFIDFTPFQHSFRTINITGEANQFIGKPEYHFILESFGFESESKQTGNDSHYLENTNIKHIFRKKFDDVTVELIFVAMFETNFDLSFREYFYNGDTIFYTEAAEKDRLNKEISVKSFASPFSTLLRIEEFKKRYPLTINEFSREQLTKYIKVNFFEKREQLLEKFSYTKKYNNNDVSLSLTNEITSLTISPFENELLSHLKNGFSDFFFLFQEKMKIVLNDEKNDVAYNLEHKFAIKPLELQNNYLAITGIEDKKKFYELIKSNFVKTAVKMTFTNEEYMKNFVFNKLFFNDLEKNNIIINITKNTETSKICRSLNMFILSYHLEQNPLYKLEDFMRDGILLEPSELNTLYYAATSKNGMIKMTISNLVFEQTARDFLFYYDSEQTVGIDLYHRTDIYNKSKFERIITLNTEFAYFLDGRFEEINDNILSVLNFGGHFKYLSFENKISIITASILDNERLIEFNTYMKEANKKIEPFISTEMF